MIVLYTLVYILDALMDESQLRNVVPSSRPSREHEPRVANGLSIGGYIAPEGAVGEEIRKRLGAVNT